MGISVRFRAFRLAEATDVRGRGGRCRFRGPGLRSARLVRRGRLSGLFAGYVRAACLFGPEFFGEGSSGGGSKSGICVRSASPKTVFANFGTVLPPDSPATERPGKVPPPRFLRPADVFWLGAQRTVPVGRSAEDAVRSRRSRFLFAAGLFRRLPERNLFEAGIGSSGGVRCFVGSPGGVVSA